jgi:hypothetical protein
VKAIVLAVLLVCLLAPASADALTLSANGTTTTARPMTWPGGVATVRIGSLPFNGSASGRALVTVTDGAGCCRYVGLSSAGQRVRETAYLPHGSYTVTLRVWAAAGRVEFWPTKGPVRTPPPPRT